MKNTWVSDEEKELEERIKECLNMEVKASCFIACARVCVVEHFFDFIGAGQLCQERTIYLRYKSRGNNPFLYSHCSCTWGHLIYTLLLHLSLYLLLILLHMAASCLFSISHW